MLRTLRGSDTRALIGRSMRLLSAQAENTADSDEEAIEQKRRVISNIQKQRKLWDKILKEWNVETQAE